MSLVPKFFPLDVWNSFPSRFFDSSLRRAFEDDWSRMALRSWMDPSLMEGWLSDDFLNESKNKDKFETSIECKNYHPEEIKVKVAEGFLVIEGKHEKKSKDSFLSHNFMQKVSIPDDVIQDSFACNMDKNGVLKITAKKKGRSD